MRTTLIFLLALRLFFSWQESVQFERFLLLQDSFIFYGEVCSDPKNNSFLFCVTSAERDGSRFDVKGKTYVRLNSFALFRNGDELALRGLKFPQIFMYRPKIPSFLDVFRDFFLNRFQSMYGEPAASFFSGILIGLQPSLPADVDADFRNVGLTHILVVSGSNVSLFAGFLSVVFSFVRRKKRMVILLAGIIFFVAFVGFSPPALRAGIMGGITFLALGLGRSRSAGLALFYAAMIMLLIDPLLLTDKSFQLSFLATAAIIFVVPLLPKVPMLLELFFMTLSVELLTLPVLFSFGQFSLIAPVSNMLLLPFLPIFLAAGMISFVLPFLAPLMEWLVGLYIACVQFLANVPFSHVEISPFPWWAVVLYYAALILLYLFRRRGWGRAGVLGHSG